MSTLSQFIGGPAGNSTLDFSTLNLYAYANVFGYYSDERLKDRIGNIENALDKVLSLDTFTYKGNWLAGSFGFDTYKTQVGLSAQQVEAIQPEIVGPAPFDIGLNVYGEKDPDVSKSGEHYKTIQYERLIPLLIAAIKEQQIQIEELKLRVA